jgi:hypothetical protein
LGVKPADRFFGDRPIGVLDECETARASGLPIDRHNDLGRLPDGPEVFPKVGLSGTVRQVSNEQAN